MPMDLLQLRERMAGLKITKPESEGPIVEIATFENRPYYPIEISLLDDKTMVWINQLESPGEIHMITPQTIAEIHSYLIERGYYD